MLFLDMIVTTWLFWPLLLGVFVLFAALTENDHGGAAGVIAATGLVGLQLFSSYQPLTYIAGDPIRSLYIGVAYLVVGFIYMYIKWSFVAHKASLFFKANPTIDYYTYNNNVKKLPFNVGQWKSELLTWFVFWPFSGAWTLLNDPIRIIFDTVYAWSSKRLQSISDHFFKV